MTDVPWLLALLRALALLGAALLLYPLMAWVDRWAQLLPIERQRLPRHPLLPFAYALKLLSKRAALPASADFGLHVLAPFFGFVPGLLVLACLPPGPAVTTAAGPLALGIAADASLPLALGLLFTSTAGIALAGWAGGNPLALLGALRLSHLRVAALLVLGLASLGVALIGQTTSLTGLLEAQGRELAAGLPALGAASNPIGFVAALLALGVFSQRAARSRPDENAELVEPYAAEATGPTLLLHRWLEIVDLTAVSALVATVFLGGWLIPGLDDGAGEVSSLTAALSRVVVLALKTLFAACLIVLTRRALPLLRHDQALSLLWALIPVATLGLVVSGVVVAPVG